MNSIVTQSAFASLCGVSNARVSQWLADGKLDGEAIIGHGHRARIRVVRRSVATEAASQHHPQRLARAGPSSTESRRLNLKPL